MPKGRDHDLAVRPSPRRAPPSLARRAMCNTGIATAEEKSFSSSSAYGLAMSSNCVPCFATNVASVSITFFRSASFGGGALGGSAG